jgi:hypothetical protein
MSRHEHHQVDFHLGFVPASLRLQYPSFGLQRRLGRRELRVLSGVLCEDMRAHVWRSVRRNGDVELPPLYHPLQQSWRVQRLLQRLQ